MGKKVYNKLVRDKIPEIIEADNRKCDIEVLSQDEYLNAVDAKLDEELAEYHKDKNLEELADLLEVIYAATKARGYSIEELEGLRKKKADERGAFDKRILLKSVTTDDESRNMNYLEVVNKAKQEVSNRGLYGDIKLSDCKDWQNGEVINLWSYWQGYQLKDIDDGIDILLVGQDWGNPSTNHEIMETIRAIQSGDEMARYVNHATSVTDKNLIELFGILGCDITKENPGRRILFTNYCLAYRTGSETGGMTKSLLQEDEELFNDLVKAVKPKIIICLGKITYETVTGIVAKDFVATLKEGKPFEGVCAYDDSIRVYGVAHCGARGVNNVGGKDVMKASWKRIAENEGYY